MKKYTLFSFTLIFFFLFGFSVNVVDATVNVDDELKAMGYSNSGCMTGDKFNRNTGQSGDGAMFPDCKTGDLFSSITGRPCKVWQNNSSPVTNFNSLLKLNLKFGSKGDSVKTLQQILRDEGYYFGKVDGKYGKITERAVKDFQDDNYINTTINNNTGTQAYNSPGSNTSIVRTNTLSIKTSSPLPKARVGKPYWIDLSGTGGNGVYGWNTGSSVLPPGMNFSITPCPVSGPCYATSSLVGTPTYAGTYTFYLILTSGDQSSSPKQFTLTVDPAASTCSNSGYDTTTGFRCGCNSTSGYSYTNGEACDGSKPEGYYTPVITGIDGPTSLYVNEEGTWNPKATFNLKNPDNEGANYWVTWGDGTTNIIMQHPSFSHSFSQAGSYNILFYVQTNYGTAQKYLNVNVKAASTCSSSGIDSNTGLRCGCTSNSGYSSVDGEYCGKLTVSYLSPNYGPVETQVKILGSGFTSTGNKVKFGDLGGENNPTYSLNSSDGKTLVFNVPSSNYMACWSSKPACMTPVYLTPPGTYPVSVINANGTSNSVNFTVTSGMVYSNDRNI